MSYEPNVMRKAMARLERRRDRAERARYMLEQELYAREPRLKQVDAGLRKNMIKLAELAIGGKPVQADGPEIAAIRAENEAMQKTRAALLAGLGYGPDALDEKPACPRCGDTGWVEGKMCACLKELCAREQMAALTALLSLTDEQDFDKLRLDIYRDWCKAGEGCSPREQMEMVIKTCRGFARQFPEYPLKNLLLSGGTGLGKTFLSGCVAREVAGRGFSVVYDTASGLFAAFDRRRFARDAVESKQARDDARRYLACDLLILDDLGSEFSSPLAQATLYEVVNDRLQAGRHTIISTNLSKDDIAQRYTPQVASRIGGLYQELTFYGDDLRFPPS